MSPPPEAMARARGDPARPAESESGVELVPIAQQGIGLQDVLHRALGCRGQPSGRLQEQPCELGGREGWRARLLACAPGADDHYRQR
jgi:hypothetical protein